MKSQEIKVETYGRDLKINVNPPDRAEDVLYFLITGCLKGNRSLNGVTWTYIGRKIKYE